MKTKTIALIALSVGAAISFAACQQQQQETPVETIVILPAASK